MIKGIKTLVFFMLAITASVSAQDNFSVQFAQNYTRFSFKNSLGEKDTEIQSDIRYSYGVNYSKILGPGILLRPEIGYKNWGANSVLNGQKLSWNLHYADFNLGVGYIYDKIKIKPYAGAAFYVSYLYKADQMIVNNYYNMLADKTIKSSDYGAGAFLGAQYAFTDLAGFSMELRQNFGLNQLEPNNATAKQTLYNRAFSIHFGLMFYIPTKSSSSFN